MAEDQRLPLNRLSGAGFAPREVPTWDGRTFKPGTAGSAVPVSATAPTDPAVGQLWYDIDDTC